MRNRLPDTISAQRYRLQLRQRLIDAIEAERVRTGLTRKTVCNKIGFSEASYARLMGCNGAGSTIDSLILFLHRLGIEVEISVKGANDLSHIP